MSSCGYGSCPRCREEYFNCRKPQNCKKCRHYQGGTFQGAWKKIKSATPVVVEISQGVFLCRTTGWGDCCFITSSGDVVVHPWGVQDLEVSSCKQWFGLPVWVWPCEVCQEPWHVPLPLIYQILLECRSFSSKAKGSRAKGFPSPSSSVILLFGIVFSGRTDRSLVQSFIFFCFPIGACGILWFRRQKTRCSENQLFF